MRIILEVCGKVEVLRFFHRLYYWKLVCCCDHLGLGKRWTKAYNLTVLFCRRPPMLQKYRGIDDNDSSVVEGIMVFSG